MATHITIDGVQTITNVVELLNDVSDQTEINTDDILEITNNVSALQTDVSDLTVFQGNLDSRFDEKLNKAGDTLTGALFGTTFRAQKGAPNSSNLTNRGFGFGADGDTGLFAVNGSGENDTSILAFYIQNAQKMTINSDGNVGIVGIPTIPSHLTTKSYVDSAVTSSIQYFNSSMNNTKLTGYTNVDNLGIGIPDNNPTNLLDIYTDLSGSISFRTDTSGIQLKQSFSKTNDVAFTLGLDTNDSLFKLSSNVSNLSVNNILTIDNNGNYKFTGTTQVNSPNNTLGLSLQSSSGLNKSGIGVDANANTYLSLKDSTGTQRISANTLDGNISSEKISVSSRAGVNASVSIKSPTNQYPTLDFIASGRSVSYDWRIRTDTSNNNFELLYGGNLGTGYGKKFGVTSSGGIYTSNLWSNGPSAYMNELVPRAYVNFNVTAGIVDIASSFNVDSVIRNAAGDYIVNFSNSLPSGNYVTSINAASSTGVILTCGDNVNSPLKNQTIYKFISTNPSNNVLTDVKSCSVIIFGG